MRSIEVFKTKVKSEDIDPGRYVMFRIDDDEFQGVQVNIAKNASKRQSPIVLFSDGRWQSLDTLDAECRFIGPFGLMMNFIRCLR